MHHIIFEFNKLWRSNLVLLSIIMALFLSLANFFVIDSQVFESTIDQNDIADYADLSELLYDRVDGVLMIDPVNEGQQILDTFLVDSQGGSSQTYQVNLPFFSALDYALRLTQRELTPEQRSDLDYAVIHTDYLSRNEMDVEHSLSRTTTNSLLKYGDAILYGIIPLLFFMIVSIKLYGEDIEKGSDVYNHLLPQTRTTTLVSRIIALSLLIGIYLLSLLLVNTLIGIFTGSGIGDLLLPNRLVGNHSYLANWAVIARIFSVFYLRCLGVIILGIGLVLVVGRYNLAWILGSFLITLISFLSLYLDQLQTIWNPFYFDYYKQILGNRTWDLHEVTGRVLGTKLVPSINFWMFIGIGLLLLLVLMIVVIVINKHKSRQYHNRVQRQSSKLLSKSKHFGIVFEWLKLSQILTVRNSILLSGLVILPLMILIHSQDHQTENQLISQQSVERYQVEIDNLQSRIDTLLEEDTADEVYDQVLSHRESMKILESEYLESQTRLAAYIDGDSDIYYESIKLETNHWFEDIVFTGRYLYGDGPSNFGHQVSIERLDELIRRDIDPIANPSVVVTIYDRLQHQLAEAQERLRWRMTDHSFLGSSHRLISDYRVDLIVIALVVVLAGAGFTLDKDNNQGLSWMRTLPTEDSKLLRYKSQASVLRGMMIVMFFIGFILLYSLFTDGFGHWNLPVLTYLSPATNPQDGLDFTGSYAWINLIQVIGMSWLLIMINMRLYLRISLWLSSFFKQSILPIGMTLVIMFGGYLLVSSADYHWFQWLPFGYLDTTAIVIGEKSMLSLGDYHYWMGIVVVLVWTLLVDIGTHISVRRHRALDIV